ncbi:MAG: hypothetical protein Q9205_004699, partial [Flavoplaca limonia]
MTQPVDAQNGIVADKENIPQSDSTPNSTVPNTEKSVPAQNLELGSHPRDATEDEVATLPHVTDRIPIAAWIVILAGAAERATYFGVIAPWQNYMQNPRGAAIPGALGLGQSMATNIFNAFFLFSFLTPMAFALLSDIYIGRYKSLIAGDQYVQKKPQLSCKNGKYVIVDGTRTLQLLYNLYYWFTNIAALSTIVTTFLEKEVDFWAAYTLCTVCLFISILVLLLFAQRIVKVEPRGNNLPLAMKVGLCAARSGWKLDHSKQSYQAPRGVTVPWSDKFVDELKRGLMAISYVIFYLCVNQMFNNLVSQAGQMNLHGVPNDMIQAFSGVACILIGPAIQYLFSFLAKRRIAFGPIARIAVAFFFCGGAMAYSAGVQKLIYNTKPCYNRPRVCPASKDGRLPNDINVWVQIPVYFILAVGEIFGFVTASEYAYSKAPPDMKTIVQALVQLTACVGSALGMALSPVAKDPEVLVMYSCIAGVMVLAAMLFYWRFKKYDKIDEELNQMNVEEMDERVSGSYIIPPDRPHHNPDNQNGSTPSQPSTEPTNMSHSPPSKSAISQYSSTSSKLAQRAAILSYDTNLQSWYTWLSTRLPTANHDILEVGAGSGELWTHIDTSIAKSITLTDFSPAMCDKLREMRHQLRSTQSQSQSHPDIPMEIQQCDAASLPFENGSFDLVIANHMLYHLDSPSTALSEFARVLRPGGALRVSLNGRDHISELLALGHQIGRPSPI